MSSDVFYFCLNFVFVGKNDLSGGQQQFFLHPLLRHHHHLCGHSHAGQTDGLQNFREKKKPVLNFYFTCMLAASPAVTPFGASLHSRYSKLIAQLVIIMMMVLMMIISTSKTRHADEGGGGSNREAARL